MALRNAFERLLTETVAGAVEAVLTRMDARQERQSIMEQPRSLQYARNSSDCMRIEVTNSVQSFVYAHNTSGNVNGGLYYSQWGSPQGIFTVDDRWQQAEQTMQTFNQVRANRWVFS